jgi:DNA-binding transcriptional LysR family regulator
MDSLLNIRAFVSASRGGSFSAAARDAGVSPSVITKRISQLEHMLGVALFQRSTRSLRLTDAGAEMLPRCLRLVADFEDTIRSGRTRGMMSGRLRIKSPSTVTSLLLGGLFSEFAIDHPGVVLDLVLLDRSVDPIEEGFDLAISARPATYPSVVDTPLSPYPGVLVASPSYIATYSEPTHPSHLIDHDCLVSLLYGGAWRFESDSGEIVVDVRQRLSANDGRVLLEAARRGVGIAILPEFVARNDIAAGRLVPLIPDCRPVTHWLKALVPSTRTRDPMICALLNHLTTRLADPRCWEQQSEASFAFREN